MVRGTLVSEILACTTDEERLAKFQSIALESVRHGIVITERRGNDNQIVCCNPAFEEMTGYSHTDLTGRDCRLLQGPDTDASDRERLGQAIARGESCTVTLKNYRKNGSSFWNEITVTPVREGDNTTGHFVGIQKDVTDRHSLQERKNELSEILEESLNEIYIFAADDLRFLNVNHGARTNLGYSMAELAALTPVDIKPNFDVGRFMEILKPLTSGAQDKLVFDTVHQRKDGSRYPVEVHLQCATYDSAPAYAAIILDTSGRETAAAELRESYEELRSLSARLQTVRDEERQRLARELHDDIAQLLAAAQMDLAMLKSNLNDCSPDTAELLESIKSIADRSVISIRRLLNDLRPKILEDAGLFAGIEILADDIGRRHQLPIEFLVNGKMSDLPDQLVTPVYRLVQESLSNVAKHARASKAEIELICNDSSLTVRIRDDGIGLPTEQQRAGTTGFGLTGMRERVTLLGGDFSVCGHPGRGTEVLAVLPIFHKRQTRKNGSV